MQPTCDCCNSLLSASNFSSPLPDAYCENYRTLMVQNGQDNAGIQCKPFITCFSSQGAGLGTDRWVYILIQGIALALVNDFGVFNFFLVTTAKWTISEVGTVWVPYAMS